MANWEWNCRYTCYFIDSIFESKPTIASQPAEQHEQVPYAVYQQPTIRCRTIQFALDAGYVDPLDLPALMLGLGVSVSLRLCVYRCVFNLRTDAPVIHIDCLRGVRRYGPNSGGHTRQTITCRTQKCVWVSCVSPLRVPLKRDVAVYFVAHWHGSRRRRPRGLSICVCVASSSLTHMFNYPN